MTRSFVDTNIFVYRLDDNEPRKQAIAEALVQDLIASHEIVISTEILQELFVTLTRKLSANLDALDAEEIVRAHVELPVVQVDVSLILRAMDRIEAASISFWDALVVEAALVASATRLLTEDLQHGQVFDGRLRVENPFRPG